MNVEEYILSGILETYVLGIATPEEQKEIENLANRYPEIRAELAELEKTVNSYAAEYTMAPPAFLKEKIIAKVTGKESRVSEIENNVLKIVAPSIEQEVPSHSYWAIAASILLLISVVGNVYFMMESRVSKESLSSINKVNNDMKDSLEVVGANYRQAAGDLAILKDPMYKMVELKGMKAAPDAKAMVCWCPMEKKVYVEVDKLPAPPQGMQYQLWAMVDGKPVSEGMITIGSGLHRMPDIGNAQAFAVTLEKQGGNPTPQGEMYVMGTI